MARGLDVLRLLPSEHLTQNEIDAAGLVQPVRFNAQRQRRVEWPAQPVVARAYLDQLRRDDGVSEARATAVTRALDATDREQLTTLATTLEREADDATGQTRARMRALAATMTGIASAGD